MNSFFAYSSCFILGLLTFSVVKSGPFVLACTRGLQDCPVLGASVCQLLDRTGTAPHPSLSYKDIIKQCFKGHLSATMLWKLPSALSSLWSVSYLLNAHTV